MAFSGSQVTRFGLSGGIWRAYGDFSGKEEAEEILGGGKSKKKKRQEDYDRALEAALKRRAKEREAIQAAVQAEKEKQQNKRTLRLKKKVEGVTQEEITQLAQIENDLDLQLAIEYQLQYLDFKRREDEALAILLLIS